MPFYDPEHREILKVVAGVIWAAKLVHRDMLPSVVRLFRDQACAFDPDQQMLLVSVNEDWPMIRIWVAVPDLDLLTPYYGFESCKRSDLPIAPVLLAGCAKRFGNIFHGP